MTIMLNTLAEIKQLKGAVDKNRARSLTLCRTPLLSNITNISETSKITHSEKKNWTQTL